jgi:hypothetical protein
VCHREQNVSIRRSKDIHRLSDSAMSRLTVTVRVSDRAASVLLVDRHRVAIALPYIVVACRLLERQSEIGDLVLVP